jgi:hypothetical protein
MSEFDPKVVMLILGGVMAVLVAYFPLDMFIVWLRTQSKVEGTRSAAEIGVPVWITGTFERLGAFGLGLFDANDAGLILAAWLGAKLAASWQRYPADEKDMEQNRKVRAGHLVALIVGTASVAFGFFAGLTVRHLLGWVTP